MRRTVVSPAQRAEMRGDISGSDGLPESERMHGKIACQETGGRAQVSRAAYREIRVIWRKPDCLNPSLRKAQVNARRKDARNRRQPLRRDRWVARRNPPGRRSDALSGHSRRRTGHLSRADTYSSVNMGSPKGREFYGDGVPVCSRRGSVRPIWRPGKPDHRAKGHRR
jgi:hypothetical protein